MLLITGCAIDTNTSDQPKMSHKQVMHEGQGELPNSIGEALEEPTDATSQWINASHIINEDLWKKAGYALPTGKWFFHNGAGKLGYGLTTGTQKAGDPLVVSFIGHKENGERIDRDVRIQLTEIDLITDEMNLLTEANIYVETVIKESNIFSSLLPEEENKAYILSVEILDKNDIVEDTRVSFIYVPKQEINASLSTDRTVFDRTDTEAILTLDNDGPTHLTFGMDYTIEQKINEKWYVVPLDQAFPAIGIILNAGKQHEQTVDISGLDEVGDYRIVKKFRADGLDLSAVLATEFVIQ